MGLITSVFNQKVYPGAGDEDDCVVVATIQCYNTQPNHKPLPTVPVFRRAAGVPDRPGPTGMTVEQAGKACKALWPEVRITAALFTWTNFTKYVYEGRRPASVSVHSGKLPARLQHEFTGLHQVAVYFEDRTLWVANPLQKEGSMPEAITPHELHVAAGAFPGADGEVFAVLFPRVPLVVIPPTDAQRLAEAQRLARLIVDL